MAGSEVIAPQSPTPSASDESRSPSPAPQEESTAPDTADLVTEQADVTVEHHTEPDPHANEQINEHEYEIEMDLQPAHRAEALDALAQIELKFALLREAIYVEKMDGLTWEDSLVQNGQANSLFFRRV